MLYELGNIDNLFSSCNIQGNLVALGPENAPTKVIKILYGSKSQSHRDRISMAASLPSADSYHSSDFHRMSLAGRTILEGWLKETRTFQLRLEAIQIDMPLKCPTNGEKIA